MKLINENLIRLNIELESKEEIIKEISNLLENESRITNKDGYIGDVYDRENIVATELGDLIAIPHALSEHVAYPSLVFLRLSSPIVWKEEKVQYIFGIAVPKNNENNIHLKVISSIARKMLDDDFKEVIQNSSNESELVNFFLN